MSKQELDLLHYQNKVRQLQQLLDAERKKNKELLRLLAEIKWQATPWLKKLEKVV